jgi:hypothetical protein
MTIQSGGEHMSIRTREVDTDVSPICYAKTLPADPAAVTTQVTDAITTLTVQIIADKVTK